MLNINSHTKLERLDQDIALATLEQNIVLLNINTNKYYDFNQTGADIWTWLETPKTLDELCNLLIEKYSCSYTQASQDITKLITKLYEYKLVKVD